MSQLPLENALCKDVKPNCPNPQQIRKSQMEKDQLFDNEQSQPAQPVQPLVIDLQEPEYFDNTVSFPPITPGIRNTARQMQNRLNTLSRPQKEVVLVEYFMIRRIPMEQGNLLKHKCPVGTCGKEFKESKNMKTHLERHPELQKHGIVWNTAECRFDYGEKAIDYALLLARLFPEQVRRIIRKMKTRPKQKQ